jgi:GAF domain-containing protein
LIVNDARSDPQTTGDPAIEAFAAVTWAGYPIEDADGAVLGTFCLMDSVPHEWTAEDLLILATLAQAASTEIALRRSRVDTTDAEQLAAGTLWAARSEQAALIAHLSELVTQGELGAQVEEKLVAWLGDARGPSSRETGRS